MTKDKIDLKELWNKYVLFCTTIGWDILLAFWLGLVAWLLTAMPAKYLFGIKDMNANEIGIFAGMITFLVSAYKIGKKKGWIDKL